MSMSNKNVQEGISGVYPNMSLWAEFGSALVTAAFLFLPYIFDQLRIKLDNTTLTKYVKEILKRVKQDQSKDSLRVKLARATQSIMYNPNATSSTPVNYEQLVLNLLPKDLETKKEEDIVKHVETARERLGLPKLKVLKPSRE